MVEYGSIYKILESNGIPVKASGKDFLVKCLNPDHEDTNPSCRIDQLTGIMHCYSCGFKGNIYRYFGIITNTTSIKTRLLKNKLRMLQDVDKELDYPDGYTPYTQQFRGISVPTLKKFGAFYTNEDKDLANRVIFPIKDIRDRIIAFIGRHVLSNEKPKYYIFPRHVGLPLFPSKLETNGSSVILVEGIIDMLNLYDKGITNVACAFGVTTLHNSVKTKLMPFKVQGVTTVYIMFDGDKAGRDAAKSLKPKIEAEGFNCIVLELPDDKDPGDLDLEEVTSIKESLKKCE